jgi:hypothetical protein
MLIVPVFESGLVYAPISALKPNVFDLMLWCPGQCQKCVNVYCRSMMPLLIDAVIRYDHDSVRWQQERMLTIQQTPLV